MDMMEILRRSGGVEAIAGQLGISPTLAATGAEAMLPAILGGFKKRSHSGGAGETGLGGLIGMLGTLGGGAMAGNVLAPEPTDVNKGNEVLGQIFGTKEVSRTVAGQASGQSGLDAGTLKKMLPILAMLVGGYLSSRADGDDTGDTGDTGGSGGGLGGLLGSVLGGSSGGSGGSGLGAMLDLDGDGNPLDDLIGLAGKFMR